MSVIVKGMEMPSGCQSCDFSDDETRFCKAAKEYIPMLGKPGFCHLVELPKKHGRLIEAERLRAEFPYPSEGMGGWRNPDEALVHKTGVWAAIDCAETIVEAEG